jgi:hypothetical protein
VVGYTLPILIPYVESLQMGQTGQMDQDLYTEGSGRFDLKMQQVEKALKPF